MSEYGNDLPRTSDLEYDLAHEAANQVQQHHPVREAVHVATQTPQYDDGDYGYDLAHDVPGR